MGHELSNFIDQKSNQKPEPIGDEIEALNNHILIAGFGRVGQTVAKVVSDAGYSYVALDLTIIALKNAVAKQCKSIMEMPVKSKFLKPPEYQKPPALLSR